MLSWGLLPSEVLAGASQLLNVSSELVLNVQALVPYHLILSTGLVIYLHAMLSGFHLLCDANEQGRCYIALCD